MKIKSVLSAVAALAVFSCASVCAFADDGSDVAPISEDTDTADTNGADGGAEETTSQSTEAQDPMEGNPVSGVDGLAAAAGVAMVAGAALVISRKHN